MTSQTAQRRLTAADFTTTYTINMTAIGEHGNHYVAYGHVEPREFIYELRRYNGVQSLGLDDDELFQMVIDQDFGGVRQEWAALTADSPDDEWLITWADVTEETPAAFPITRLVVRRLTRPQTTHHLKPLERTVSSPAEYRKKPIVIKAMQWDGTAEGAEPILVWIKSNDGHAAYVTSGRIDLGTGQVVRDDGPSKLSISTLEGHVTASAGDFVIRGVQGEFYPCKPDIFAATYDAA